jgi:hypothetical protein
MKTIDAIKLTLANFQPTYLRGRAAQNALAPFATASEVLDALGHAALTPRATRDAITLALIAEHRRTGLSFWQSILLVAYEPLLANVLRRLRDRRDAEQRILLAFLEALASVSVERPPSLLALHLRHATERGVFGPPSEWQREPEMVSLSSLRRRAAPDATDAIAERHEEMEKVVRALESLFGDAATAAEALDVLLHARTGREPLERLVRNRHPELSPRARAHLYERWQRLRRRALAELEARFGRADESLFAA